MNTVLTLDVTGNINSDVYRNAMTWICHNIPSFYEYTSKHLKSGEPGFIASYNSFLQYRDKTNDLPTGYLISTTTMHSSELYIGTILIGTNSLYDAMAYSELVIAIADVSTAIQFKLEVL
jgi:hypothetical protein